MARGALAEAPDVPSSLVLLAVVLPLRITPLSASELKLSRHVQKVERDVPVRLFSSFKLMPMSECGIGYAVKKTQVEALCYGFS